MSQESVVIVAGARTPMGGLQGELAEVPAPQLGAAAIAAAVERRGAANRQRLAAARELLRTTNLSVGEVAWQVGLHDVSYFTALFQKHEGLTPGRYRKSVRGKLFSPVRS